MSAQLALIDPAPSVTPGVAVTPPALRPYQHRVVVGVAQAWAGGANRVLVLAATGSGKTVMAAALVRELLRRGRRVLFIVHRDVLIDQTVDKLAAWGCRGGFIKAGRPEDRGNLLQIASIQTLERRDWWYRERYDHEAHAPTIILDECHITAFARVTTELLAAHSRMRVAGLTATPWRLSPKEDMGDVFEAHVCAPFPGTLMDEGHLVRPVYYGTKMPPDLSKVHTRGGEFVEEDILEACDRPELIASVLDDWERLAPGQRTLAFASGVRHAAHIAAAARTRGIPAACVDGETPIPQRNALYAQLRAGTLLILASCMVLQEGFDVPEVGCTMLCRPTKSHALYHQQVGRGLRIAPGKSQCTVLDQAGNVGRFGFVEEFCNFTLQAGNPAAKATGDEPRPPVKKCPDCDMLVPTGTRQCPGCGYEWPPVQDNRPTAAPGPLQALTRRPPPLEKDPKEERAIHYLDLVRQAHAKGYQSGWAAHRYRDLVGKWPPRDWPGATSGLRL